MPEMAKCAWFVVPLLCWPPAYDSYSAAQCYNCHTTATPLWCKDDEEDCLQCVCACLYLHEGVVLILCRCGLYYKLDGSAHPTSKSNIICEHLPHDARCAEASASVSETPTASPDVSRRAYPAHSPASSESPSADRASPTLARTSTHLRQSTRCREVCRHATCCSAPPTRCRCRTATRNGAPVVLRWGWKLCGMRRPRVQLAVSRIFIPLPSASLHGARSLWGSMVYIEDIVARTFYLTFAGQPNQIIIAS
jgi:hypothetical protein